ncbi:microtubule-associated protein 10 [Orycteropus afer afer]|uniref:Microtubule-associated protein 10 n=1 Tax=Orycteropus afer afer TaxID=1230840 RepID=A0A8B6ZNI7_ORYAF|nr:microtubule-associated protein 10 [Orycteropus afer afer]
MAAPLPERLFSLELLVDWVRLEAGVLPSPAVAVEEEEEVSPPPPAGSLCPAVAFRLLDFPTLLVYPPAGPAAESRPGMVSFGRGKSCLFRLYPATLHRLLLRTPLYALLLQLTPGYPTPAPQLLGSCGILLADAAQKVLGSAASTCSQGHRGSYPLRNLLGERIGDIALRYCLTDLGRCSLGHFERPVTCTGGRLERVEGQRAGKVSSQTLQEKQQFMHQTSEPNSVVDDRHLVDLKITEAQKDLKEIIFHSDASSDTTGVKRGKINSVICANASSRCNSPLNQEELDIETNTFCPPPLYYTHLTQEKPPALGKITFVPQVNVHEELDGIFQEGKCVNPPTHTNHLKYVNTTTNESPSVLKSPPTYIQDIGASNQTTCHPQTEQNRTNTIRQLPLLNALLVELSLLCNQPMSSPTYVHPHLARLSRTEDKKAPNSSSKLTRKSESKKEKPCIEEKSVSLQYVENLKKGMYFEKNSDVLPKRVPRRRLLYGITNTLKLRLKQTNPDMLAVHEKREKYRKMQAQMLGAKLRIQSSKRKVLSFTEQLQKRHQLLEEKCLDSDVSFAENSDTSRQISEVFDDLSTTKVIKLKCATETVDYNENRINSCSVEDISAAKSIISEEFTHANTLEGKVETVQSPCVFKQDAIMDRITVGTEKANRQVKTTDNDILTDDISENSCSESISELKYSDDFTSLCYSEDICTNQDTSKSIQAHDSSPENPKCQHTSKSCEAVSYIRKYSNEKSSILSPPFSAGSPVHSYKTSHTSKIQEKSYEEASSISTSDLSSSHWTEEKEKQIDQNSMCGSKVKKGSQDFSIKTKSGRKSLEKSQSLRTSQVSSYLPSNLSELEHNALDSSTSDQFEEDSGKVGSLNISKQCKDICELIINKLPGYTV